ncbi:MAG: uroporphyrinogen decarboxylase [Desulfococcus sp. 4484_241]|nr:MAG: uroporphyrinogen decarboxylase [Desulfococcus sp. 4484_241]
MGISSVIRAIRRGHIPPVGEVPEPFLDFLASMASFRGKFQKLTSQERIIATFRHKEPDRVPVSPILCAGARQISGITFPDYALDAKKAARVFLDGFELVGGDVIILMLDLSVEAADFGQSVKYPENSTPMPDYTNPVLKHHDDYRRIKPVLLSNATRMKEFVKLCRIVVDEVGFRSIVSGFVFGPLGVLAMMRGAENLFKDCRLYPDKVKAACGVITESLVEFVLAQCEAGVSVIAIDTLFASRSGLPKELWEELEGPFAKEISRAVKSMGRIVAIHNCGDSPYFDAQIRSVEPALINFSDLPDDCSSRLELKRRYGDHIILMGHIPTPLLVYGSPKDVIEECRRHIDDLAPGGGYILSPGCEYPPNASLVNAFALIHAAKTYGRK